VNRDSQPKDFFGIKKRKTSDGKRETVNCMTLGKRTKKGKGEIQGTLGTVGYFERKRGAKSSAKAHEGGDVKKA